MSTCSFVPNALWTLKMSWQEVRNFYHAVHSKLTNVFPQISTKHLVNKVINSVDFLCANTQLNFAAPHTMERGLIVALMTILLLVDIDMLTCFRQQQQVSSWRSTSLQLILRVMKDPMQQKQENNHSRVLYSSINPVVDSYTQTTPKTVNCICIICIVCTYLVFLMMFDR